MALVVSFDGQQPSECALQIEAYTQHASSSNNSQLIDAYLSATDSSPIMDQLKTHNTISSFLFGAEESPSPNRRTTVAIDYLPVGVPVLDDSHENYIPIYSVANTFATKKYKPVTLRTKPVLDELPSKF